MSKIKFGTDGWRALIAKDFTVENVARVAEATAQWLLKNFEKPTVVLGYDTRFGGKLFSRTVAKILAHRSIKVFLVKDFVSTPMVSLGIVNMKASIGIIITAGQNPHTYSGIKLKDSYGGPMFPEKIQEIEALIQLNLPVDIEKLSIKDFETNNLIKYVDLETAYCNHIEANFDLTAIRASGLRLAYDAMFGAGQNVIKRLLPNTVLLHCKNNPSFNGQAPEPIHENLQELSELIKTSNIDCGIATDGDAERIGLYNSNGRAIDSNHIILLLIKYLYEYKGMQGKVVTTFSSSEKTEKLCQHFGLEHQVTKIDFKYIAGIMIAENVLLGGDESEGIVIKGHIPERDGIWIGLTILEYIVKTGRSLQELIQDVYDIVGSFSFEHSHLLLQEELKNETLTDYRLNSYKGFGRNKMQKVENPQSQTYSLNEDELLKNSSSSTKPVLRNHAGSDYQQNVFSVLKATEQTLLPEIVSGE